MKFIAKYYFESVFELLGNIVIASDGALSPTFTAQIVSPIDGIKNIAKATEIRIVELKLGMKKKANIPRIKKTR